MPANHGFGLDQDEGLGPTGPDVAKGGPKQPIAGVQGWPRSLAFQHGDLLAQSSDFEGGITPTSKERAQRDKAGKDRFDEHEPIFYHDVTLGSAGSRHVTQVPQFRTRSDFGYEQGLLCLVTLPQSRDQGQAQEFPHAGLPTTVEKLKPTTSCCSDYTITQDFEINLGRQEFQPFVVFGVWCLEIRRIQAGRDIAGEAPEWHPVR